MYSRYAERQRWRVEILSMSEASAGGIKEVIALVSGDRVYSRLRFEGGVHRVQRVPGDRGAGAHPHVDRDGRGAARGRRGRRRRSTTRTSRSTSPHRAGRAGRASTRPTAPCRSRTSRAASSSSARTSARSSRTSRRRMKILRARLLESEQEEQHRGGRRGAARHGRQRRARREDPHLQLPAEPRDRSPHRAHAAQARSGR